jgi:hypothetical protein
MPINAFHGLGAVLRQQSRQTVANGYSCDKTNAPSATMCDGYGNCASQHSMFGPGLRQLPLQPAEGVEHILRGALERHKNVSPQDPIGASLEVCTVALVRPAARCCFG